MFAFFRRLFAHPRTAFADDARGAAYCPAPDRPVRAAVRRAQQPAAAEPAWLTLGLFFLGLTATGVCLLATVALAFLFTHGVR